VSICCYQPASELLSRWSEDLLSGRKPTLYPVGKGEFARIEVGPGLVTLLGGAPGVGKTALGMQWVVDALRLTPSLRACVCNVEMTPQALLDRQLARLSGVDLSLIRHRRFGDEHRDRIEAGLATLKDLADRLCFVQQPFSLANLADAADAFQADLLLLDYVQRVQPPGGNRDRRGAVEETMARLRDFAGAGSAVLLVAAVARSKDSKGRSSYDGQGLGLASFRESSELEFGADDAFILVPPKKGKATVTLRHLKSRNSEPRDIQLHFDKSLQRFIVPGDRVQEAGGGASVSGLTAWSNGPFLADRIMEEEE
jgi:replicative DNA helicase